MRSKFVIIVCIGILSVFIFMTRSTGYVDDFDKVEIEKRSQSFKFKAQMTRMNDQPNHLFWFVQISDIHISIFRDAQRIHDFRKFATETLDTIKPPVVLASGDLTDARGNDYFFSQQFDDEWKIYHDILSNAKIPNKTIWLDLRGNHDNFNVPPSQSANSHFRRYSIQGPKHQRSYSQLVKGSDGDLYSFIAVDACLQPGPKRPYNFVGMLTQNDTDHLQHLVDESRKAGVNYTIWFGHYPTTCIITKNKEHRSLRRLISDYDTSLAYMCGHLHSLAGMVPRMYALQANSFLELEVADWKAGRKFRVAAIDHGLLSFVDIEHGTWPIVLITNPKHALFHIPHRHEAEIQLESTHIRILAFSPSGIKSCAVQIDADFKEACKQINDNFFVVRWDPKRYKNGLHHITVVVVDNIGRENQVTQPFKLDESTPLNFDILALFVLRTDATTIFKSLFWCSLILCVFPLIFLRLWHELIKAGLLSRKHASCRTSMSILQQFWILASVDRIVWPIIIYCFYLAFGPWIICEIVDGRYGAVFVWGIYLDGSFLPGSLTYFYGFAQLLLCQFPLNWIYTKCLAKKYYHLIGMPTKNHRGWWCSPKKISQAAFYFIIIIEILLSIFFGILYGAIAFILGVCRTWSVFMNIYLFYLANNIPDHALRSAVYVWSGVEKPLNQKQQTELNETDENHSN